MLQLNYNLICDKLRNDYLVNYMNLHKLQILQKTAVLQQIDTNKFTVIKLLFLSFLTGSLKFYTNSDLWVKIQCQILYPTDHPPI